MKKRCSILLAFAICFTLVIPVSAVDGTTDEGSDKPVIDYNFLSSADISINDEVVVLARDTFSQNRRSIGSAENKREVVILVPKEGDTPQDVVDNLNSILASRDGGSKTEEKVDKTASGTAYVTIYYNRKTENGRDLILLTKVSGGFDLQDRHTYISGQEVRIGCINNTSFTQQELTKNPTTLTWSYETPSSWKYVPDQTTVSIVGVQYTLTFKRDYNDTTWTLYMENYIVPPDVPGIESIVESVYD